MAIQDILFIVGASFLGLGVLLLGVAAYLFFNRNIRDIIADLNGTKRAEALEAMAKEAGRSRRRTRAGEATGALPENAPTGGSLNPEQVEDAQPEQQADVQHKAASEGNASATTVIQDDSSATTVLEPDAADATTLLENTEPEPEVEVEVAGATTVMEPIPEEMAVQESREPIPDSFQIVRKIVLSQSTEFIRPEQGDDYA